MPLRHTGFGLPAVRTAATKQNHQAQPAMIESLERRALLANITIHTGAVQQTIESIGGNYAQGYLQRDAQDTVGTITVSELDPRYVRVGIPSLDWEAVNDNDDPSVYNLTNFNESGYIRDVFNLIKQFKTEGRIVTATAFNLPDWMVSNPDVRDQRLIKPGYHAEAAEHIAAFVKRAWEGYGAAIDYVSFNEANGGYRVKLTATEQADLIEAIGTKLKAAGLNTKFIVGDTYRVVQSTQYIKTILDDPGAQPFLGPLSFHSWWSTGIARNEWLAWREIATAYGKDLWNAEMNWNAKIQDWAFPTWSNNAIEIAKITQKTLGWANADAALYWQYQHDYELMNSSGSDKFYSYYVIKSYADHLKPGSQIVSSKSDDSAILPLAGRDVGRDHFMTNVVNSGETKDVTFTGLPNKPMTWVLNAAGSKNLTMGTFTPVNGQLTLSLPAESLSTLYGDLGTPAPAPASLASDLPSGWKSVDIGGVGIPGSATELSGTYTLRGAGTDIGAGTYDRLHYAYKWLDGDGQIIARIADLDATDPSAKVGVMVRDGISGYDRMAALVLTPQSGLQSAVRTSEGGTASLTTEAAGSLDSLPKWLKIVRQGDVITFYSSTDGASWSQLGLTDLKLGKKVTVGLAVTSRLTTELATGTFANVSTPALGQSIVRRAGHDASVRAGSYANTNYGSSASLLARTSSTASNVRESYLRFDLSGIGAIGSARLRVYGRLNDTANPSVVVGVYGSSNTSWTEGTITWNTRPARSSTALAQQTVTGTTSRWYEWDVTAHLKALKTAGATAVTLVLANPTATTSRADFQSDEAAGNRPELVIDADQVQPPPPQNVQVRPGHDALVRSGSYGSTNYGSTTGLYAGRSALSSNTRESYLKFDITQFSSSADLITLRLFGRVYEGPDPSVSVGVYSTADTSWSESTITWNSRPPRSTTALATVAVSGTTDKWYVWDVTQYVLARKAAGDSVVTFVLAGTVTSETRARFNSDEVGSNGPLLVES